MKKIIVLIVSAISISAVMYLVFSKTSKQGVFQTNQDSTTVVLEGQQPPYHISPPDRNMISAAFNNATYDLGYLDKPTIPTQRIIQFVEPYFYPPNGFSYDNIRVHITDYAIKEDKCEDEICRKTKRNNNSLHGYQLYFVHIIGRYLDFNDEFIVGVRFPLENATAIPELITFRTASQISPSLANEISTFLENISKVMEFRKKYNIHKNSGRYYFYRSEYNSFKPYEAGSVTHIHEENGVQFSTTLLYELDYANLPKDKNYIIVIYEKYLSMIPEVPVPKIYVFLTSSDYKVVKIQ